MLIKRTHVAGVGNQILAIQNSRDFRYLRYLWIIIGLDNQTSRIDGVEAAWRLIAFNEWWLLLSCDAASIWDALKNFLAKSLVIIDHQVEELLSFAIQRGVHIARAFALLLFWFRSCWFLSRFITGTHRLPFSGVLTLIALLYFGLLDELGLLFNLLRTSFFLFDFIKIKLW